MSRTKHVRAFVAILGFLGACFMTPQVADASPLHGIYCSVTAVTPVNSGGGSAVSGEGRLYCTSRPDIVVETVELQYFNTNEGLWNTVAEGTSSWTGNGSVYAIEWCSSPYIFEQYRTVVSADVFHGNWTLLNNTSNTVQYYC